MNRSSFGILRLGLVVLVLLGMFALFTVASAAEKAKVEKDVKVTLDQVPAAVKAAIEKETKGAEIKEIEKETHKGKTTYGVDFKLNGKEKDIKLHEDGTVFCREEIMTISQVPAPVKAAILKESKGGKIDEIEMSVEDGKTTYGVDLTIGGKSSEIEVDVDGRVIKREEAKDKDKEGTEDKD